MSAVPTIPETEPFTYGLGDWVEYRMGEMWGRARWLGPSGRNSEGRFVRRGSDDEAYLLDCRLSYTRLDVDRGTITISPTALSGYAFDPGHELLRFG